MLRRLRRHMNVTLIEGGDPFAYRSAWLHTIHVATTGNDSTGDGTKTKPYLTLTKAMTVAVAGDGILVADGVYAENTTGSGTWTIDKNLVNWLVIEPEKGASGSVTITGSGVAEYAYNIIFGGASAYLKFRYLKFGTRTDSVYLLRSTQALDHVTFDNCVFDNTGGSGGTNHCAWLAVCSNVLFSHCTLDATHAGISSYGVYVGPGSTWPAGGLLFEDCTIKGSLDTAGTPGKGVYVSGTNIDNNITFSRCTISGGNGFSIPTGGVVTFSSCDITTPAGCLAGQDGSGTQTDRLSTTIMRDCTVNKDPAVIGHALLFGYGACDSIVDNVTIPAAYDYALVIKAHTGTEIENCHLTGGTSSALLYKAALSPNAHNNVLVGTGTVGAFQLRNGDNGDKCGSWQFQNNTVNVTGGSKALNIGNDTHDLGGGICDYNTYQNNSGLGIVRNDANVADLTELQAAWADYDVTTNDAHSTVV